MRRSWIVLAIALTLAGCSGKKPIAPADTLWTEGNEFYDDEAWDAAIDKYKALLDQHPFDPHAEEAELKIAQSYYGAGRWAEAIAAFSDFERMHPTSNSLPMVEYQIGMSSMAQSSTSDRDQSTTANALGYFRNVVDRFPGSPWAERAALRMRECKEQLARHDVDIATYYLRHGNMLAAEARLKGLLETSPESDATAEALWAFAKTYDKRDETDQAKLALATLVRHHPYGPLADDARQKLGGDDVAAGPDPLPELVAKLNQLAGTDERKSVPAPVSAYPNLYGGSRQGQGY